MGFGDKMFPAACNPYNVWLEELGACRHCPLKSVDEPFFELATPREDNMGTSIMSGLNDWELLLLANFSAAGKTRDCCRQKLVGQIL